MLEYYKIKIKSIVFTKVLNFLTGVDFFFFAEYNV